MAGVAQAHAEALAASGLLMRLVGQRIPDRALRGGGSPFRLGDMGVGAAAWQQEIGQAPQAPARPLLRSQLETEALVAGLEPDPLKPRQAARPVAGKVLGPVRLPQHRHPAEVPQPLTGRQPSPETGAVQVDEEQLGIGGRLRQENIAGGQIPE
ncbi:MAG: hypothetical protein F4230_02885, partial [Holophagales bacterium]|nr:hypothetical protein [Holophagales bacterium]